MANFYSLCCLLILFPSYFSAKLYPNDDDIQYNNTNSYSLQRANHNTKISLDDTLHAPKGNITYVRNFYLWTREYRYGEKFELLNPMNISSIKYSNFQSRKTYIIIHGFLGFGLEDWVIRLKHKFLFLESANIISVDWPAGDSWVTAYPTTVHKVPYVANDVALLLQSLIDHKGAHLDDVHMIGHSLGAHVSGLASKLFEGSVGRITGLDPAGPEYHKVDPNERLDKKDAGYVDIIHTNACEKWIYMTDCFGLGENIGHSDFWPNGGLHQPFCKKVSSKGDIGCDHMISHDYFIESLDYSVDTNLFLARPCANWTEYLAGSCPCGDEPQHMGINVNTMVSGVFYLMTDSSPPYALPDLGCSSASSVLNCKRLLVSACALIIIIVMVLCLVYGSSIARILKNCSSCSCCRCCHKEYQEVLIDNEISP